MQRKRYINWNVSYEDYRNEVTVGYSVTFVDAISKKPLLYKSSYDGTGEFEYDGSGNMGAWEPIPSEGLLRPFPYPIRFGYTPAGCKPMVYLKGETLYRMSFDSSVLLSSTDFPGLNPRTIHGDVGGGVRIFDSDRRTSFRIDQGMTANGFLTVEGTGTMDLIPDTDRGCLWQIEPDMLTVRTLTGEVLFSHSSPRVITAIKDSMVDRQTGDLFLAVQSGVDSVFMHFGRVEGWLFDAVMECPGLSRWAARSATICSGNSGLVSRYVYGTGLSVVHDLSAHGIGAHRIVTDGDSDYYVLDRLNRSINKIEYVSGNITWHTVLPASVDNNSYDISVDHRSPYPRPVMFWATDIAGGAVDSGASVVHTGNHHLEGEGCTLGILADRVDGEECMVKISTYST